MDNKEQDDLAELRKLLDPKAWPKYDGIIEGEPFRFRTDDPLEERIYRVLYR